MDITKLNDQCLLKILNCLSIGDQMKCTVVCKRWYLLIEIEELSIYYSKPFDESCVTSVAIRTYDCFTKLLCTSKLRNLRKLLISINNDLKSEPLIDLSNLLLLAHLEIDYYTKSQSMIDHLIYKKVKLTNLTHLNVYCIDLCKLEDVFPNLTHLKTVYIEDLMYNHRTREVLRLEYFEQYHSSVVDRMVIKFLNDNCTHIKCLSLSVEVIVKFAVLIQRFRNLSELNLNIPTNRLRTCFKSLKSIFEIIGPRDIVLRVNGLRVKGPLDKQATWKFVVDPEEIYTITYADLQTSNQLVMEYEREDLEFYYNNFKEIEITEKALQIVKPLFIYELTLKRVKKLTYHFRNRNSANYFIDQLFGKMPNVEGLFIAEVENLTESQLNRLPVLFPKCSTLELHAYKSVEFPIRFIAAFVRLQAIYIKSNGFIKDANFHQVIKDLHYLTHIEVEPSYNELFTFLDLRSKEHPDVICHLHRFSSDMKSEPNLLNNTCVEPHRLFDDHFFESFNDHNYHFD